MTKIQHPPTLLALGCACGMVIMTIFILLGMTPVIHLTAVNQVKVTESSERSHLEAQFLIEDFEGTMRSVSFEEFRDSSPSFGDLLILRAGTHELVYFEGHHSEIGRDPSVVLWINIHCGPYG